MENKTAYASEVCAPIMIENGSREVCLCVHGFCGSPGFYIQYENMIRNAGYDMCAPLLSGHGTKPDDLKDVKAEAFVEDVDRTMDDLLKRYDTIHLLGASMGGSLCTYIAGQYASSGKIGKVLLMVPAYALRNKDFYKIDYENCGNEGFPLVQSADTPPELVKDSYLYDFMYKKSIGQLIRLCDICEKYIDKVTAPVWLLYTNADPVVDPAVTAEASKRFKNLIYCHAYEKSGHNLMLDCERDDVNQQVEAYLKY